MFDEIKEMVGLLLKDPKAALVVGVGNATTGIAGYLDWIPQTDLAKVSMIFGIGITIPLIFSHWVRLCKDVYQLKVEKQKYFELHEAEANE